MNRIRHFRFLATSATIGVTLLGTSRISRVYAEEVKKYEKPRIYDDPKPEIVLEEVPTRLEAGVRKFRLQATRSVKDVQATLRTWTNNWIEIEQKTEKTIKDVISPEERLMPEVLYIAVATFAGMVITRNRNILIRLASPVAFAVAASYYFIPRTARNITNRMDEYGQESRTITAVRSTLSDVVRNSKESVEVAVKDISDAVTGSKSQSKKGVANGSE
ncbi:8388_t:CDS:2 [Paraglomus brasilianum]|uniref:MICOS complex subunit n=1 Tax=Paraglomus brasilianum TaxID=144538 RepID=A0A9N8W2X3_9GLOM|nr:8388_t:CDS:2 [Paraglomus brasilianum]